MRAVHATSEASFSLASCQGEGSPALGGDPQASDAPHGGNAALVEADRTALLRFLLPGAVHDINNANGCIRGGVDLLALMLNDVWSVLDECRRSQGEFLLAGMPYEMAREEFPQLLDEMRGASDRITHTLSELRDLYGCGGEREEYVDVNGVVAAAVRLASGEIRKRTDCFEAVYEDRLPSVRGHRHHLFQVVATLLARASRAVTDRTQAIRVTTRRAPDLGRISIEVEDAGSGTPSEAEASDSKESGPGLRAVYAILAEYQGALGIDAVPGRGTRAIVSLPLRRETLEPQDHVV